LLALAERQRSAVSGGAIIRSGTERGTKLGTAISKIEKERQHEDEP
jgi:hypothetical protein